MKCTRVSGSNLGRVECGRELPCFAHREFIEDTPGVRPAPLDTARLRELCTPFVAHKSLDDLELLLEREWHSVVRFYVNIRGSVGRKSLTTKLIEALVGAFGRDQT